jgi:hypothetical protein
MANDKKKLMVLGAMGVVFVGLGVFQFTKASGGDEAAPEAKPAVTQSASSDNNLVASNDDHKDGDAPQQNNLVTGEYPYRDPFKALVDSNARQPSQTNSVHPVSVASNTTNRIPPFPGLGGSLPSADGGKTVPIKPPAPEFGYTLAGVIMGRKPAAVFIDAQGAQHLVQLGGSLDGDTQLVNLDRDGVQLRVKGKDKNLTLGGGDTSAK